MTSPLPSPPRPPGIQLAKHPSDLFDGEGGFFTQIHFMPYNAFMWGASEDTLQNIKSIILPIPAKLNDVQTVVWTPEGLMPNISASSMSQFVLSERMATGMALLGLATTTLKAISIGTGLQLNPLLWMMFKSPDFKKFVFEWHFTPVEEKESEDLVKIINHIKIQSLPGELTPYLWKYPSIAYIKFYPDEKFTFKMKPCAVTHVDVDYTAANMPSFFKNGAPTAIRLRIAVVETKLWTKDNYDKKEIL